MSFHETANKVAAVTAGFWFIKIMATTLGETGGDAVSMGLNLGYAAGTGIFLAIFLSVLAVQLKATRFHPFLYWGVVVATTTVGTTLADFCTRSLGIGYVGGSALLFGLVIVSLVVWRASTGTVSVSHVVSPKAEAFYWLTILTSNPLGTALGDFMADSSGVGYGGSALVFGAALMLVAALYYFTRISRALLFWAAFILTRPLGATLGDLLTKPLDHGGFALSQFSSSAVIALAMLTAIMVSYRRRWNKQASN